MKLGTQTGGGSQGWTPAEESGMYATGTKAMACLSEGGTLGRPQCIFLANNVVVICDTQPGGSERNHEPSERILSFDCCPRVSAGPVTEEITAEGKTEAARKGHPQRRPRGSAGIGQGAYSQQHGILRSAELVSRVDLTLNALTTKIKETKTNHKGDSRKLLDVLDVTWMMGTVPWVFAHVWTH